MNAVTFLLRFILKNKFWFFSSLISFCVVNILTNIANYYYGLLLGYIGTNPQELLSRKTLEFIAILAGLYISADVFNGIRTWFEYRLRIRIRETQTLTALFKAAHKHSPQFFAEEMSGNIAAKILNLRDAISGIFFNFQMFIGNIICGYAVALLFLFRIDAGLSLSLLSLCIAASIINYYNTKSLKPFSRKSASLQTNVQGIVTDSIANSRLIKNAASFPHEKLYLRRAINLYLRAIIKESQENGISNCYNSISIMLVRMLSLMIIVFYWYAKDLSLTQVLIAYAFLDTLLKPIQRFSEFFLAIQKEMGIIGDAVATIYKPLGVTDSPAAKKLQLKNNTVIVKNMSFSYTPDKPLFQNFNLNITPNEKIGIVGLSGSGKSTLISLILRAYNLNKGKILISGHDISKVTQHSLHQNIALISQEPCLFNRSIMENIRFANPAATDEQVYQAAKLAYIHETIIHMPNGYNSVVGERGVKLSGGERQRIAIAAAILKNAPILILDEATSALDSESEAAIQKALQNIMQGKTVLAIAHRLSTLKNMNRIIVLENGKIIENGSRQELLKNKSGLFRRLYNLQSEGYLQT